MKGVIIYKGKYGATRQYAQWLGEALQIPVYAADDAAIGKITQYDFVIGGGSVYVGKWQLKAWVGRQAPALQQKKFFSFIVCGTPASEKEKLRKMAADNIPASLLATTPVYFLPGKVIHRELSWLDRFALKMGARFAKPEDRKHMLAEFNKVDRENIQGLVAAVKNLQAPVNPVSRGSEPVAG
jgi:menaquinone-dependent protoporphyrinogen IX oxidase